MKRARQTTTARRTLGFMLRENSRLMRRCFMHHARNAGLLLNLFEASLVWQLVREPGIRQSRVATLLDLETISVVRLVDSLGRADLLERRPHPTDRRIWTLWLTESGQKAVDQLRHVTEAVRREALAGMTQSERDQVLDMLLAIRRNLQRAAEDDTSLAA